jgi:hypothetical protein
MVPPTLCGAAGKVTGGVRFAIRPGPDVIPELENYRSFLDIYDLVRSPLGAGIAARPAKRLKEAAITDDHMTSPVMDSRH